MKLSEKHCVPCEGGTLAFTKNEIAKYISRLNKAWKVIDYPVNPQMPDKGKTVKKLRREFNFKNFTRTMGFVNEVALLAAAEDHHPDMQVSYCKVVIELWTHAVKGLSENDFILAAKIEELL